MILLIFDCDGVLVDSEVIALDVLAQMLTEVGQKTTVGDCRERFMGKSPSTVLAEIEEMLGRPIPFDVRLRARATLFKRLRRELRPVQNVGKVIAQLPYKVCVASSSPPDRIILSLTVTGLSPLFAGRIFSATEVRHGKPAPDLFLHAAQSLGMAPRDTIVIEDAPAGVTAALRAGMGVIGFAGASHADAAWVSALSAAGAAEVVTKMDELPDAIERLRAKSHSPVIQP